MYYVMRYIRINYYYHCFRISPPVGEGGFRYRMDHRHRGRPDRSERRRRTHRLLLLREELRQVGCGHQQIGRQQAHPRGAKTDANVCSLPAPSRPAATC